MAKYTNALNRLQILWSRGLLGEQEFNTRYSAVLLRLGREHARLLQVRDVDLVYSVL